MPAQLAAMLLPMLAKGGMGMAGQTLEVLPTLLPNKADKLNKKRLQELERLEAKNKLGLSGQDKRTMRQTVIDPATKSVRDLQQLSPSLQPGMAAGDTVLQRMANQQAYGQVQAKAGALADQTVRAADEAKKKEQLAELEARTEKLAARRQEQQAAALSIPTMGLTSGAKEYEHRINVGQGAPNELTRNQTAAQGLLEQYANDPEMLDLILSFSQGI